LLRKVSHEQLNIMTSAYIIKKMIKKQVIMITLTEKRNNFFAAVTKSFIKVSKLGEAFSDTPINTGAKQNSPTFYDSKITKESETFFSKIYEKKTRENYLTKLKRLSQEEYYFLVEYYKRNYFRRIFSEKKRKVLLKKRFYTRNALLRLFFYKKIVNNVNKKLKKSLVRNLKKRKSLVNFRNKYFTKEINIRRDLRRTELLRRKEFLKRCLIRGKERFFGPQLSPTVNILVKKIKKIIKVFLKIYKKRFTTREIKNGRLHGGSRAKFYNIYLKFLSLVKRILRLHGTDFRLFLQNFFESSSRLHEKKLSHVEYRKKAPSLSILFHKYFFSFYSAKFYNTYAKYQYLPHHYTTVKHSKTIKPSYVAWREGLMFTKTFSDAYYNFYNVKYPINTYVRSRALSYHYPFLSNVPTLINQSLIKYFTTGTLGAFQNRNRKIERASTRLGVRVSYFLRKRKFLNFPIVFVIRGKVSTSF
jgi:hypothetical protein